MAWVEPAARCTRRRRADVPAHIWRRAWLETREADQPVDARDAVAALAAAVGVLEVVGESAGVGSGEAERPEPGDGVAAGHGWA